MRQKVCAKVAHFNMISARRENFGTGIALKGFPAWRDDGKIARLPGKKRLMRRFQKASIQRKQTWIIMLTCCVALLLACATFVTYELLTFRKEMTRNLTTLAEIIGNNSTAALDFNDEKAAEETLAALRAEPNIVAACLYTKNGEVFARYSRDGSGTFQPPPM